MKSKAPGTAIVVIKPFKPDKRVCAVTLLKEYIEKTVDLREEDNIIISFVKPHKAVHVDTIRRWITTVMSFAGIDTSLYKPHSTRAASTSKAKSRQVPLTEIIKAGMWSNGSTFAKFYDKTIDTPENDDTVDFQSALFKIDSE